MRRSASVHRFPTQRLLHPNRRTTAGVWLAGPPYEVVSINASDAELGARLSAALASSGEIVPHPLRGDRTVAIERRLAADVRTEKEFERETLLVGVACDDDFEFTPYHNGGWAGPDRGFSPLIERAFRLPSAALNEELGAAIRRAIACCSHADRRGS